MISDISIWRWTQAEALVDEWQADAMRFRLLFLVLDLLRAGRLTLPEALRLFGRMEPRLDGGAERIGETT